MTSEFSRRARELRKPQTKAESLLWNALRARRLCGLKFRRQHPIEPFIADFACVPRRVVVEIDGGYHDYQLEDDVIRQKHLQDLGWSVLRFSTDDVLADAEAVAISIACQLGVDVTFGIRNRSRSGMRTGRKPSPGASPRPLPQAGEVTGDDQDQEKSGR